MMENSDFLNRPDRFPVDSLNTSIKVNYEHAGDVVCTPPSLSRPLVDLPFSSSPLQEKSTQKAQKTWRNNAMPSDIMKKNPGFLPKTKKQYNTGRWSKEEHDLFLSGLQTHGKDWKSISNIVCTRSHIQIRTHAQKYFLKMKGPAEGKLANESESKKRKIESTSMLASKAKQQKKALAKTKLSKKVQLERGNVSVNVSVNARTEYETKADETFFHTMEDAFDMGFENNSSSNNNNQMIEHFPAQTYPQVSEPSMPQFDWGRPYQEDNDDDMMIRDFCEVFLP